MNILIFANGNCRKTEEISHCIKRADVVIAADGGANQCAELGITPDILVGDLDSIDPALLQRYEENDMTIYRHPRKKDATDLELALDIAISRGAAAMHIYGALGGRWDMSIANILLCASAKYSSSKIRLLGDDCTITVLHPGEKHMVSGPTGKTASIIPLTGGVKGVTLTGFEFALEDADISFGSSLGISNVIQAEPASVHLCSGIVALVEFSCVAP